MIKFNVEKRFSSKIAFTAEIDCHESASKSIKLGLAVNWAIKNGANLSGADLRYANLRYADLSGANLSGADLRYANLRYADLSGANLSDADLRYANLRYADLSGANLSDANLRYADLSGANLSDADLRYADLSDANLRGCPVKIQNIHQTVYAAASQSCALDMSQWHHSCGTTHCRAGWVVALAGEGGKAIEWAMGTPAAAALIYMASDPTLERVPDFYNMDNNVVLEDMKRLADLEAGVTKSGERG